MNVGIYYVIWVYIRIICAAHTSLNTPGGSTATFTLGVWCELTSQADRYAAPAYRRGDYVEVFYRAAMDEGYYFPVATASAGMLPRPLFAA